MSVEKVIEAIDRYRTFIITTHRNPEADAIGSSLALAHLLRQRGKDCTVVCYDPIPRILQFLPHENLFKQHTQITQWPDAVFILDCGDLGRTGLFEGPDRPPSFLINVDHHVTNRQFGGINWVDHGATATGELIYRLSLALGMTLTPDVALCLYATLASETGFFAYSNTKPETFLLAAELLKHRVDPWEVAQRLRENTPERLDLLSHVLRGLEVSADGGVAWLTVTRDLFEKTKTTAEDTEEMISYPRSLRGVEVAVLFREVDGSTCKVSLRSKNRVDVAKLAERFGGGGHQKAAGCTIAAGLAETKQRVLKAVGEAVKNGG
jgi:bifunctional oligoribonuclease and PAP phosphatase NrnA